MLEALLAGSGQGSYFIPDSGPGPKWLLKGTPDLGYFGEVTSAEFFTRNEVQTGTGLVTGSLANEVAKWIKVIIDNKVLFIPYKGALSRGYSWEMIYNAGAALGDDTIGNYPVGAGVTQDCKLFKWSQMFRVRLLKVGLTEGIESYTDTDTLNLGEYVRIMASLTTATFQKWSGPKWGLYSPTDVMGPNWVITANTWTRSVTNRIAVISNATDIIPKASGTVSWLPILELYINPDLIYPVVIDGAGYDEVNALLGVAGSSTADSTGHLKPILHAQTTSLEVTALTDITLTSFDGTPLTLKPIARESISQPGLLPIASFIATSIE